MIAKTRKSPRVGTTSAQTWPADQVDRRPVSSLVPYANNARTHSEAQIAQIMASIQEWGWTVPVLIDEVGGIIAGHGRVLAAQKLGLTDVPVMVAAGWSATQKRAYVIADNKLAENAGWDDGVLRLELAELKLGELDLGLLGFDDAELASLLGLPKGLTDPDDVPAVPKAPITLVGDLWILGQHRVLCGDATSTEDVARLLAGANPNLMVTDPPYGVNYDPSWRARAGVNLNAKKLGKVENDDRADWTPAWHLFTGDIAYVWHGGLHSAVVEQSLKTAGFAIRAQIIWNKDRFVLGRGDYHWRHEPAWYAVREGKKGCWAADRKQDTVWNIPARDDAGHGHSTQKPVECMRRPILNNSKAGDAIYEPFCGSGTTVIASQMEGRICYGMEISPAHVDVIVRRWEQFTGHEARLDGGDQTFAQIAARRETTPMQAAAGDEHAPA
jgi:DNA modification methylase